MSGEGSSKEKSYKGREKSILDLFSVSYYIISTTSSELFMIFSYTCPSVLESSVSVLSPSAGWY